MLGRDTRDPEGADIAPAVRRVDASLRIQAHQVDSMVASPRLVSILATFTSICLGYSVVDKVEQVPHHGLGIYIR